MTREARKRNRALVIARDALALYADEHSYYGIGFGADPNAGWFASDFGPRRHRLFLRKMPGRAAREALKAIRKILKEKP